MGLAVLVTGESGTGKSTSLRNFEPDEIRVFSLTKSRLPFRKKLPVLNISKYGYNDRYNVIKSTMARRSVYDPEKNPKPIKVYVIDDSDYLMFFESMERNDGYTKYNEMAQHMISLKKFIDSLDDDVIVYLMNHVETDKDTGKQRAITAGKLISEKLGTFEALFEVVFHAAIRDNKYVFVTRSDGLNTAKTPMGMFETETVDNDLKMIDQTIREYYDMKIPYATNTDNNETDTKVEGNF